MRRDPGQQKGRALFFFFLEAKPKFSQRMSIFTHSITGFWTHRLKVSKRRLRAGVLGFFFFANDDMIPLERGYMVGI